MMNSNAASKLGKLENVQIRDYIENYFNELNKKNRDFEIDGRKNKTQETYESEIRMYFHLMRGKEKGKELEYLSMDDIEITQEDYEAYIDKLCSLKDHKGNNKYVNKTINKKTAALKSILKYLKKKKVISTDISYLELIKNEKEKKTHYGVLLPEECLRMADLCLEEREKGYQKRQLILLALKTGLRVSELLDLTWNSFIKKGDDQVFIKGIGKGNKLFEIKIPTEIYDELQTLNKGQNKVFDISARRVCDLIDRLRNKMNIPPERLICFHSIRKCFGTTIWKLNDIEAARRALRHENIATTQLYLGELDYDVNDSIFSIDKIPEDYFKNVSHDELIAAIENLPKNLQLILNLRLHEIKQKE
jgi:integrase